MAMDKLAKEMWDIGRQISNTRALNAIAAEAEKISRNTERTRLGLNEIGQRPRVSSKNVSNYSSYVPPTAEELARRRAKDKRCKFERRSVIQKMKDGETSRVLCFWVMAGIPVLFFLAYFFHGKFYGDVGYGLERVWQSAIKVYHDSYCWILTIVVHGPLLVLLWCDYGSYKHEQPFIKNYNEEHPETRNLESKNIIQSIKDGELALYIVCWGVIGVPATFFIGFLFFGSFGYGLDYGLERVWQSAIGIFHDKYCGVLTIVAHTPPVTILIAEYFKYRKGQLKNKKEATLPPRADDKPALPAKPMPVSPMQVHIDRGGQRLGPYSVEQVNSQLSEGTILPTDLGWTDGMADWVTVTQIAGVAFADATATAAVPPPTPAPTAAAAGSAPVSKVAESPEPQKGYIGKLFSKINKKENEQKKIKRILGRENMNPGNTEEFSADCSDELNFVLGLCFVYMVAVDRKCSSAEQEWIDEHLGDGTSDRILKVLSSIDWPAHFQQLGTRILNLSKEDKEFLNNNSSEIFLSLLLVDEMTKDEYARLEDFLAFIRDSSK
jgi:hypothetical protein